MQFSCNVNDYTAVSYEMCITCKASGRKSITYIMNLCAERVLDNRTAFDTKKCVYIIGGIIIFIRKRIMLPELPSR